MQRFFLLCLALWPTLSMADAVRPLTLEEALRRAEEASPVGRAITSAIERARAEVSAAGLWPNPDLSLTREESAGTVEKFENLSVPILLTGRLGLERASARKGLAAEEASARQEWVSLRARVREAFLALLEVQQRTSTLETGRSRLVELVEILRVREREGESSGYDGMRAERELADLETDLLEARGGLEAVRATLASLVVLPGEGLVAEGTLDPATSLPGLDQVLTLVQARGDLVSLDAQADRADLLARAARRRAVPEPSITIGRKGTDESGSMNTGPVLGLAFTIPLLDRGQGARGMATAEGALLRARREALESQASAEAEAAYAEAAARREAEQRYAAAGDPHGLITIARAAYEGGEMRIFELLDAYRTALAVRLRMLELRAAARKAEVALGRVAGAEVLP